jgi:hypothetical protein
VLHATRSIFTGWSGSKPPVTSVANPAGDATKYEKTRVSGEAAVSFCHAFATRRTESFGIRRNQPAGGAAVQTDAVLRWVARSSRGMPMGRNWSTLRGIRTRRCRGDRSRLGRFADCWKAGGGATLSKIESESFRDSPGTEGNA